MFEQVLNEITPEYEDKINMYKVDIDKEREIASLFGVRGIPFTTMISKNGDKSTNVGGMDAGTLEYYLKGLIQKIPISYQMVIMNGKRYLKYQ